MKKKKKSLPTNITIKFEHLNSNVQSLISNYKPLTLQEIISMSPEKIAFKEGKKFFNEKTIKGNRRMRGTFEILFGLNALGLVSTKVGSSTNISSGIGSFSAFLGRDIKVIQIKKLHEKLVNTIKDKKKGGLLQTTFEGNYPKDWINPLTVAKTHPIMYVNARGDVIFHRVTRLEYYRYKFQQRFKVAGWRWRVALEPPVAPKKIRDWTKAQLEKIAARIPKIKPKFAPEPSAARIRRKNRKKNKITVKLKPRFA